MPNSKRRSKGLSSILSKGFGQVPPDGLCFFHCIRASLILFLWCAIPRQKSGFPKDSAITDIETKNAVQMRETLKARFQKLYGKDCRQVEEINKGAYMVEFQDFSVAAALFRIRLRVTVDHSMRSYIPEEKWDTMYGDEGYTKTTNSPCNYERRKTTKYYRNLRSLLSALFCMY